MSYENKGSLKVNDSEWISLNHTDISIYEKDLAYFSYSNNSIIERSKFHQLTEDEGKKIAAYIRSLDVLRHGRPWNPPYQPGKVIDKRPIEQWAAGAGIDAVLENDADCSH